MKIKNFNPYRTFTDDELQVLLHDKRTINILAIIYGTTRSQIQELRNQYRKQHA